MDHAAQVSMNMMTAIDVTQEVKPSPAAPLPALPGRSQD